MTQDIIHSYASRSPVEWKNVLAERSTKNKGLLNTARRWMDGNFNEVDCMVASGICGAILGLGFVASLLINY